MSRFQRCLWDSFTLAVLASLYLILLGVLK